MIGCDDPEFANLDAYIAAQLTKATETYSSCIDAAARLAEIRENGHDKHIDEAAVPER